MSSLLHRLMTITVLFLGIVGVVSTTAPVYAAVDVFNGCSQVSNASGSICADTKTANSQSMIKIVINTILYLLGAVAVVMIIVGGIRYTLSAGDSAAVKGAKNTILYAVVGLIVAIMAYAIVNFVITTFK